MKTTKLVTTSDPKVLEFLRYLGIDASLSTHVVITIPLEGAVIVEVTRMVKKLEDEKTPWQ